MMALLTMALLTIWLYPRWHYLLRHYLRWHYLRWHYLLYGASSSIAYYDGDRIHLRPIPSPSTPYLIWQADTVAFNAVLNAYAHAADAVGALEMMRTCVWGWGTSRGGSWVVIGLEPRRCDHCVCCSLLQLPY